MVVDRDLISWRNSEIVEKVRREIEQDLRGELSRFTTNGEIGAQYGVSVKYVGQILRESDLDSLDRKRRKGRIITQVHQGKNFTSDQRDKLSRARKNLSPEEEDELSDLLEREVRLHGEGSLPRFTTNGELQDIFGVARIYPYVSKVLAADEIDLRARAIQKQANSIDGQVRKRIVDLVKGEIERDRNGELREYTSNGALASSNGVSKVFVSRVLAQEGISEEDRKRRARKLSSDKQKGELNPNYGGITQEHRQNISKSSKGKTVSEEHKRKLSETGRRRQCSDETRLKLRDNGVLYQRSEIARRVMLEGRLFGSRREAALGILLERYVPDFEIIEGKTFQVDSRSGALFDFVLPDGSILEYHPPNITYDASNGDKAAYKELIRTASNRERSEFKKWYLEELAIDYWVKRQDAADRSPVFHGREVVLVRDFEEFYTDILMPYGGDVGKIRDVEYEYLELVKQAKDLRKCKLVDKKT
ncbi:MAG: hypothetical protein ABH864_00430 [archaeon]